MRVFITGASGFVGTVLCAELCGLGYGVVGLCRGAASASRLPAAVEPCLGDPREPGDWQHAAAGCDAAINLAGANIFGRWTAEYKELIRQSRVACTRNLAAALEPGAVLINASAVGYYGPDLRQPGDETAPPGDDFLARVCREWEAEADAAAEKGCRVVKARFGIILGRGGGALARMLPAFRLGLGGPLGSGRQWLSWIHLQDLVRALVFCLENPKAEGPLNFTAPQPVTSREFARALGKALGRPAFLPTPAFALKLAMGEMAGVLLASQRALPARLQALGFEFRHPRLSGALGSLL